MPVPYAFTKQKLKVCLCACPCSYRIWERALEIFDMSLVVDDRLLEFFADGFKGINFGTRLVIQNGYF